MPVLRVPIAHVWTGDIWLDEASARYVGTVHRAAVGDHVVLFDPVRHEEAIAEIVEKTRDGVCCRVGPVHSSTRASPPPLMLLQAIGKGDKLSGVVRDATELGATAIVAIETERTVVRLGNRGPARTERWRRIANEASRQSGRGEAPTLHGPLPWVEALQLAFPEALRLCLWEGATDPLGPHLSRLGAEQPVAIAVGPEGGLTREEVVAAHAAGFAPVSLGPWILRTETVAAAVLGAVMSMRQVVRARLE